MTAHPYSPTVDDLLAPYRVTERVPFRMADGYSGNTLERVLTRDGTRYVLKRMALSRDWIMRATNDHECRAAAIWADGTLDRIQSSIDHTVVACARDDDGWAILMRDVSEHMLPPAGMVARADWQRFFEHAAAMHATFWGEALPEALCPLETRFTLLGPRTADAETGADSPAPKELRHGWDVFESSVPPSVAEPVIELASDAEPLAQALRGCAATFLHGDMKFGNLGIDGERSVFIDWQACTVGPPAVELAWFIALNATRCEGTREDLIEGFRAAQAAALGPRFDPTSWERSLELSLLGGLVQLGWNKAWDASCAIDPADRERETADLAWWIERARAGLDRL